jgi:hypothetical protein
MDQGPLVTEQLDAGQDLIREFNNYAAVRAAFWLKDSEEGEWYLYLASDAINDSNFDLAYSEVIRILGRRPHLWLDPFQVKVTGVANSVTKAVMEIQKKYPGPLATRLRNRQLGGLSAAEVYIYPIPVPAPP